MALCGSRWAHRPPAGLPVAAAAETRGDKTRDGQSNVLHGTDGRRGDAKYVLNIAVQVSAYPGHHPLFFLFDDFNKKKKWLDAGECERVCVRDGEQIS